jgi:HlyD family secretion protein
MIGFLLALLAGAAMSGCGAINQNETGGLQASGVVEVDEVAVAPEIAGRVTEVMVGEGEQVTAGDVLFRVEAQELELQRDQLQANGEAAIAAAELELIQAQQALQDLYDHADMTRAQAQQDLANARDALEDAEYLRTVRQQGNRASRETIDAAEARLVIAENQVDRAKSEYDKYSGRASDDEARAVALRRLSNARQDRDAALRALNWYKGAPDEIDQALLDADVALAEARVQEANRQLEKWQDGPPDDVLELAEARVKYAETSLQLARVQSESQLSLLDLQLADAIVQAPLSGVVLTNSLESGEVVTPGVSVMTLANLSRLRVTVYLPENQYGQVSLGDAAVVAVDSFPGVEFTAEVIRIADEAEYTPRNVQTEEDRQTTVYAVELSVQDNQGRLKPGMPADVTFNLN